MKREIIRVEPLSTYLERFKAPTSAATRSGDMIYVSGFPPFDPETGEVAEQMVRLNRRLGVNHIVASVHWPGMPNSLALEQLEVLASEVMPAVRQAL